MSDQPNEPTVPFQPSGEVETVGPELAGRRSRVAVVAGVAVAVAGVLGGGAYAAYSFLDGSGPQPADVLPASTIAVVSVDLDPSAGQKIAAIKSIRRFPALKDALGLHAEDDLREYVFDKVTAGTDCDLDFDQDVKPWLGKRAAFAGVDLGEKAPAPVIALQVSDAAEAKKGFDAVVECADPDDFAFVVDDDYLIASDTAEHARAILAKGKEKPLADDAAYQKWTGEAGDSGVVSFYVGKRAAGYAADLLDEFAAGFGDGIIGDTHDQGDDNFAEEDFGADDPLASARDALKGFEGLGGTVRFAGGGMELSVAGGGIDQLSGLATVGREFAELPAGTAFGFGLGITDDYAEKTLDQLGSDGEDFVSDAGEQAGLDMPEDLQTLLGKAVIFALGADAPASLDDVRGPEDVPAGIVIHGDADRIKGIVTKAEDHLDMHLSDIPLVVKGSGDKLAIATTTAYADELLMSGHLGDDDGFGDAVPEAGRAAGILYVDFDSDWVEAIAGTLSSEGGGTSEDDVVDNLAPLRGVGLSTWEDGRVGHLLLKLTTN